MRKFLVLTALVPIMAFAQTNEDSLFTVENFKSVEKNANIRCTNRLTDNQARHVELLIDTKAGMATLSSFRNGEFHVGSLGKIFARAEHLSDPRGGHLINHKTYVFIVGLPGSNSVNNDVLIVDRGINTQENNRVEITAKVIRTPAVDQSYDEFDRRLTCSDFEI